MEHPNIASVSSSVLTKEAVDKLKDDVDHLSKKLEKLVLSITNLKKDIEIARLKKGYLVKGVGREKEYATTFKKNMK